MGCAASKSDEEDDVVSLCGERKKLLKSAVERRQALADAHSRYNHSLYAVAAAIRLFVARHSSPSSPFLITFPPVPTVTTELYESGTSVSENPVLIPSVESTAHKQVKSSVSSSVSSLSSDEERENQQEKQEEGEEDEDDNDNDDEEREENVCEEFYSEELPPMPSPRRDFGWDFFNPFDGMMRNEVINNGFDHGSDDDFRIIREQEGIPELEEDMERERREKEVASLAAAAVDDDDENNTDSDAEEQEGSGVEDVRMVGEDMVGQEEHNKGLSMIDNPTNGRELLDALKDIEDHFVRAYGSGLDVSRMLEAKKINLQPGSEEVKEQNKRVPAITWHRTTSYQSSSCKSFLASSSKSSSTWTETKTDLFDDYGGMEAGSHSLTLGRLYAWEKKLYEEVKDGDKTRKTYEQKCSKLRNLDARGDGLHFSDKTRVEVKDLYARILITIRSAESISKKIEKLRDEELQPQLVELLHGLMRNWKIMLESHETQFRTIAEVGSFTCPTSGKFCNDSHRLATLQLEAEIHTWRACFVEYVTAQKSYIDALYRWLTKFVAPEVEFYSRGRSSAPPFCANGPPLLVICHDWLSSLEKLPDRDVTNSLKCFGKDIRALWHQQGQEQEQKRKVDGFAKELDRRILALQRTETRILESKLTGQRSDIDARDRLQYLAERKDRLDMFRKRLDSEKEKHHNSMQETQRIILNGFQTGFSSIFESLAEFAKASSKMYGDLVTYSENAKMSDEKSCNPCIENGRYCEDAERGFLGS